MMSWNRDRELRTKLGKTLTDADIEALADEAERGYDVSDQPPTEPTLWVAELVLDGRVTGRVTLTKREDADQALAAHWRIVRYVRADQDADLRTFRRLVTHAAAALERADVGDAEEAAAILRGVVTFDGRYLEPSKTRKTK